MVFVAAPWSFQTTIIGVQFDGGVVLGADSRVSVGAWWPSSVLKAVFDGFRCLKFCSLAMLVRCAPAGSYVANRFVGIPTHENSSCGVGGSWFTEWFAVVLPRSSDKVTEITDRIYTCRSGSAADTQAVTDIVRRHISEHK